MYILCNVFSTEDMLYDTHLSLCSTFNKIKQDKSSILSSYCCYISSINSGCSNSSRSCCWCCHSSRSSSSNSWCSNSSTCCWWCSNSSINLKGSSGNSFIRLCDVLDRSDSRRACWDMQSGCGGGAAEASARWRHTWATWPPVAGSPRCSSSRCCAWAAPPSPPSTSPPWRCSTTSSTGRAAARCPSGRSTPPTAVKCLRVAAASPRPPRHNRAASRLA